MIIYSLSSTKNGVSIASRVVPSTLDTITRSSFKMELTKLDFPTLGRPIQQNEVIPSYGAISFSGSFSITTSNKSPSPIPCAPLIAIGSPRPNA